jgi:two-component system, NarL family, nitrate/nitrite response regulator NarL
MIAPVRVLIADDHPPTRKGVRLTLEQQGFLVCAEVASAEAAVEAALRERPNVCLVDTQMPGDGIRAAGAIAARLPDTAVVMLTVSDSEDNLLDALRAGARGYLLKDMDTEQLPVALWAVLRGEAALPRRLAASLIQEIQRRGEPRLNTPDGRAVQLTSREWDVLELLCDQLATAEIARRLFVSPVTVRRHVSAILGKLGVSSREAAVRIAKRSRTRTQGDTSPGR